MALYVYQATVLTHIKLDYVTAPNAFLKRVISVTLFSPKALALLVQHAGDVVANLLENGMIYYGVMKLRGRRKS